MSVVTVSESIKVIFPTTGLKEPRETFIMACIGAFKSLKEGSKDLKHYEKHTKVFLSKYLDMSYSDFKKQALRELRK